MSKSRKKKSGQPRNTTQTLAALALVLSIASLGLSLYQFILPPQGQGPKIYEVRYDDIYEIEGISMIDYPSQLRLTYSANPGDIVILEFQCEIYLNPMGVTTIQIQFDNNGSLVTPRIHEFSDSPIFTTGYMKHQFEATTGGEYDLEIYIYIDDEGTNSYIRYSVLTVTVY